MKVQNIAIGNLRSNPSNPRDMTRDQDLDALASSIAQSGILVPLIVRRTGEVDSPYEVLAGHRRLMAAEGVLKELPCIVTNEEQGDGIVLALIENTQRVDLSALETARAVQAAIKGGMRQKDLAAAIGRTPSYVSKMAKIMKAVAFLEGKGTDPAYMGDYTNYEELYEHARQVLGEQPAEEKKKPGKQKDIEEETGNGSGGDLYAVMSLILGHADDVAKVKMQAQPTVVEISSDGDTLEKGNVAVNLYFKNGKDASKFFAAYGVSKSK